LAYRERPAAFVGIELPLRGDNRARLLQFSLEDGRVTEAFDIGNAIGRVSLDLASSSSRPPVT
jgi:hypothetical protein